MTADIELPPLPEYLYGREARDNERVVTVADAHAYAIRNVAHATEPLKAEIEALRAEREVIVAESVKYADKSGRLEAEVERLMEALRECVKDMQRTEDYYGEHPEAQEVISKARAALRDHDQEGGDG